MKIGTYTISEARKIAVGTARSILRDVGDDPSTCSVQTAWEVLSELRYTHRDTIASLYMETAPDDEDKRFASLWKKTAKEDMALRSSRVACQRFLQSAKGI